MKKKNILLCLILLQSMNFWEIIPHHQHSEIFSQINLVNYVKFLYADDMQLRYKLIDHYSINLVEYQLLDLNK
jgi:hypothetical protein